MLHLLPVTGRHLLYASTQTSDNIPTCLFVLPDPENMGLAIGISLLSCLQAEIYIMSSTSGNGPPSLIPYGCTRRAVSAVV